MLTTGSPVHLRKDARKRPITIPPPAHIANEFTPPVEMTSDQPDGFHDSTRRPGERIRPANRELPR